MVKIGITLANVLLSYVSERSIISAKPFSILACHTLRKLTCVLLYSKVVTGT